VLQIALFAKIHRSEKCRIIGKVDLKWLVVRLIQCQKIFMVPLLQTDLTWLGRPKSTQISLLNPTHRSRCCCICQSSSIII